MNQTTDDLIRIAIARRDREWERALTIVQDRPPFTPDMVVAWASRLPARNALAELEADYDVLCSRYDDLEAENAELLTQLNDLRGHFVDGC